MCTGRLMRNSHVFMHELKWRLAISQDKKSSEGATLTIIMPQVNDKTLRARQSFQNASHLTF